MQKSAAEETLPLALHFPELASLPRARLGAFPTPLESIEVGGRPLLVKRDDLSGRVIGGNKVRGLEFLLGNASGGDRVLTVGPRGSTHALATARCAATLGAETMVVRWDQEMNAAAHAVSRLLEREAGILEARHVVLAYAAVAAMRARGGYRWIPAGGATPLALLGHMNAALELSEQLRSAELPDALVVPLGTGGTAAGLALGLRVAGLDIPVHAVRVVPRIMARAGRLRRMADSAARLVERATGRRVPRPSPSAFVIHHSFYGGRYGRPLAGDDHPRRELKAAGIELDDTYSVKALAAAVSIRAARPLLWLTFDGRLLHH